MQSLLQGYEEYYGFIRENDNSDENKEACEWTEITKKEDEAQDAHFVLYKMQNILAFLLVVGVILMDLFHFEIAEMGATDILGLLSGDFPVTEAFDFVAELPVFSDWQVPW